MNAASRDMLIALGTGVAGVALSLWLLHVLDLDAVIVQLLLVIGDAGALGIIAFTVLTVLLVPLLAPTLLLTLGAGALYGAVGGTLLIVSAETVGALLSFWLGKHFLARPTRRWLARYPRVSAPIDAIDREDWQSVALLRMIPFFPFKLSNYALGLTPLSMRAYGLGTWLGLIPIALFNTRLGALAGDVLALDGDRDGAGMQGLGWNLLALLFTAVVCVFAARRGAALLKGGTPTAPTRSAS